MVYICEFQHVANYVVGNFCIPGRVPPTSCVSTATFRGWFNFTFCKEASCQKKTHLYAAIYFFQENDIRYLVEKIWDSQSTLSACSDLYELVLVRWNRTEEWSPWNCVLLTKDEASAHERVTNLEQVSYMLL